MSIYYGVYPANEHPDKDQMEDLFNYAVDPERITEVVKRNFCLVKSYDGDWMMTGSVDLARQQFPAFYESLSQIEKELFQLRAFNTGVAYLRAILENFEKVTGVSFRTQNDALYDLSCDVIRKIPSVMDIIHPSVLDLIDRPNEPQIGDKSP
jgi:hypothetical protein